MAKKSNPKNPEALDAYLDVLKKEDEKRKKRRLVYLAAGVLLIPLMTFGVFQLLSPQTRIQPEEANTYVVYPINSLGFVDIEDQFKQGFRVILMDPQSRHADTLTTLSEYDSWLSDNSMFIPASDEVVLSSEENSELEPLKIDITGRKITGKRLMFQLEGHRSDCTYEISFGDQYKQSVDKSWAYTYERPGYYRLTLTETDADGETRETKRTIYVAEEVKQGQDIQYASSSDEPEEVQIIDEGSVVTAPIENQEPIVEDLNDRGEASNDNSETSLPSNEASDQFVASLDETPSVPAPEPEATQRVAEPRREEVKKPKGPFLVGDINPSYPGGERAMMAYLRRAVRYPKQALDQKVDGRVIARFVVQPDGRLTDIQIVKGVGYGCDQETIRAISKMPRWEPGIIDGSPVPMYYTLPIRFNFEDVSR